ncbi:IS3 family transposase [Streptomyces sp. NPDC102467]|uniref:IS3 family transposase n=1 Tax=Streptomyces sp. NPDC102467 TaxID=3366179 RepID=UPI003825BC18
MSAKAPDLIGRDFHAERPGTWLVGDSTCLPTAEGWLDLACWLDLATREVVGYAMADHHRADLVVDALDMAHGRGQLKPGCVIHSDRGSAYTSAQFRTRLRELGLRQSCGRTGSCFDCQALGTGFRKDRGASAESFFQGLKRELLHGRRLTSKAQTRLKLFRWPAYYNRRRRQSSLDYLTPAEFEQQLTSPPTLSLVA